MQNKRNYQKELEQVIREIRVERGMEFPTDSEEERVHGPIDRPKRLELNDGMECSADSVSRDRWGCQENTSAVSKSKTAEVPSLLLHSCCAPCSSYVLEYLSQYFRITVLYFNPNIYPEDEYARRVREQRRLIEEMGANGCLLNPVGLIEGRFEPKEFYEAVRGLEQIPEGGARCFACFRLRLSEAAKVAAGVNASPCFDYFTTTLTISPLKNAQKLNEIGEELAALYHVNWLPCDFKKKNGYKRSVELSAKYGLYRQDYCGCVFSKQERERAKGIAP